MDTLIERKLMKSPIDIALTYKNKFGFCVIPVNGKIPLVPWQDWQDKMPSDEKLSLWFTRWKDAGIAVVTGDVSGGLCAVDVDTDGNGVYNTEELEKLIPDSLEMPISITPSGGKHMFFRTKEQLGDRIGFLPKTDFRSAGIIVLPFSEGYKWRVKLSESEIPTLPDKLVNAIKTSSNKPTVSKKPVTGKYFAEGRRDNDIFSVANSLVKNGCDPMFAEEVIDRLIVGWTGVIPNFSKLKVQSAIKRHTEVTLVEDVTSWVEHATGDFKATEIYQGLQLSVKDKKTCTFILAQMVTQGQLEPASRQNGHYRKVRKVVMKMNWRTAKLGDFYDIRFPMGLHDLFNISKTNLMVVAGSSNSGKTAMALNVAMLNNQHKVKYLCTEMCETELAERIAGFEKPHSAWDHVDFIKLEGDAGDYIDPDGLNIVDYIEPADGEYWKMTKLINDIHAKLRNGVALVLIQKKRGELYGKGGSGTEERCRLYIAMDFQEIELVKVKSPKRIGGMEQPDIQGKKIKFKLHNYSNFYIEETG